MPRQLRFWGHCTRMRKSRSQHLRMYVSTRGGASRGQKGIAEPSVRSLCCNISHPVHLEALGASYFKNLTFRYSPLARPAILHFLYDAVVNASGRTFRSNRNCCAVGAISVLQHWRSCPFGSFGKELLHWLENSVTQPLARTAIFHFLYNERIDNPNAEFLRARQRGNIF